MKKSTLSTCLSLILLGGCSSFNYDEGTADRLLRDGQPSAAYTHYQYLADFGLPRAQRKLGDLLHRQGDEEQALIWLTKAAANGDMSAQLKRARLFAFSQNPNISDLAKGSKLIFQLIDQGYDVAINDLIKLLVSRQQVHVSDKYLALAQQKAEQGHAASCYLFAEIYSNQITPNVSTQKIKDYYLCAAQNNVNALYGLAKLYNREPNLGSFEQVFELLKKHDSQTATNVGLKIAKKIANGTLSSWGNNHTDRLYQWVAQTDPKAYYQLAKFYVQNPTIGRGVTDILEVIEHGKAAGVLDCYALEAEMYLYGIITTQDPWLAQKLLLKVPASSPYTNFLLGALYSEGFLGEPDYPKALEYLNKSAATGFKRADRQLSKIFSEGRGITADLIAATKYQLLAKTKKEKLDLFMRKFNISAQVMAKAESQAETEQAKRLTLSLQYNKDQHI